MSIEEQIAREAANEFPGMNKEFREHLVRIIILAMQRAVAIEREIQRRDSAEAEKEEQCQNNNA